ncbi:MAG TPA: hypothetical protein VIY49_16175 [Bryobacteraceae bacterium]
MRTRSRWSPTSPESLKEEWPGGTLKDAVNQALRAGLDIEPDRRRVTFRVEPHSFGFKPGVDLDKLGQLADELEAEEFARKLRA